MLKDKLGVSNINELVLCNRNYNGGMFGCIEASTQALKTPDSQEAFMNMLNESSCSNLQNAHASGTLGAALGEAATSFLQH